MPSPYLAIEALTGSKEVWFINGYDSPAEQRQTVDDYEKNAPLLAAHMKNSNGKASLTLKPVEVFANYRQDLSRGALWSLGMGGIWSSRLTPNARRIDGTVFEAPDGTKFVMFAAKTREEA